MQRQEPDVELKSPNGYEIIDGQFVKKNGLGSMSIKEYKSYSGARG
jgi:hypothetical protein